MVWCSSVLVFLFGCYCVILVLKCIGICCWFRGSGCWVSECCRCSRVDMLFVFGVFGSSSMNLLLFRCVIVLLLCRCSW